jgi:hypothetical protein
MQRDFQSLDNPDGETYGGHDRHPDYKTTQPNLSVASFGYQWAPEAKDLSLLCASGNQTLRQASVVVVAMGTHDAWDECIGHVDWRAHLRGTITCLCSLPSESTLIWKTAPRGQALACSSETPNFVWPSCTGGVHPNVFIDKFNDEAQTQVEQLCPRMAVVDSAAALAPRTTGLHRLGERCVHTARPIPYLTISCLSLCPLNLTTRW